MKKLKRVTIINFQSHAHSVIELDPGFNAIVGSTDDGKTGALRAIKFGLYNEPSGLDFIRIGTQLCEVILEFDDGLIIHRMRSSKINRYIITYPDGSVRQLDNFGAGPQDIVIETHGMYLIEIGGTKKSLNIAGQHDPAFFVAETPNSRADLIGSLAHTETIDDAIDNTNSDIRSNNSTITAAKSKILDWQKDLEKYDDLDEIKSKLDNATSLMKEAMGLKRVVDTAIPLVNKLYNEGLKREGLTNIITRHRHAESTLSAVVEVIDELKSLTDTLALIERFKWEKTRQNDLNEILGTHSQYSVIISDIDKLIDEVKNYKTISNKITSLSNSIISRERLKSTIATYRNSDVILQQINDCQNSLFEFNNVSNVVSKLKTQKDRRIKGIAISETLRRDMNEAADVYKDAIVKSKKCFVCLSNINEETVERITTNLR